MIDYLCNLGLCDKNSIEEYYPKVRDRNDIEVFRCKKSGLIFLSSSAHIDDAYYRKISYWTESSAKKEDNEYFEDTVRRSNQIRGLISNKKWADVGAGTGALIEMLSPFASEVVAVEPQSIRGRIEKKGYTVYDDISCLKSKYFDIITLFHVIEHVPDPVSVLKNIYSKLLIGGKVFIEVPHAKDVLIDLYACDKFKKFTFWSEHLILHTRDSIKQFLALAGFENIIVQGCQRYSLSNHLYWLSRGLPCGQVQWAFFRDPVLESLYNKVLYSIDCTDTLTVIAEKV